MALAWRRRRGCLHVGPGDRAAAVGDGAGLVRGRRLGGDPHVVGEAVGQLLGERERPVERRDLLTEMGQGQPLALQAGDRAADAVGGLVVGGTVVVDDRQRGRVPLTDAGTARGSASDTVTVSFDSSVRSWWIGRRTARGVVSPSAKLTVVVVGA